MAAKTLDVITIGRSSVDLYGQQVGGRLEDMSSFAKYVGGSPTNTAIGAARLGLKSALITGVGDEHMGRFIKEQLVRENVDIRGVKTDPERLTALVILGIRDQETFPLIFYRENSADMAISQEDIDPDFIASSRTVVLSGTHFSTPTTAAASRKAAKLCRESGGRVAFDIDYRPVLWGIGGHNTGEERFVASGKVTEHLHSILSLCDLVVGTEEELHIAGGTTNTLTAIKQVRKLTDAVIVCKRGAMGCLIFPDTIPDDLEKGLSGPGFPIEVYNVLGAGDAFMSGFLRGWIRNESWEMCAKYANACGALTVSRHGCAPAIPTWTELSYFFEHGSPYKALRKDPELNHIHRTTTRRKHHDMVMAFAIDHRKQFVDMAEETGADLKRIGDFKMLSLKALTEVANGRPGFGTLLDGSLGQDALHCAMEGDLWVARPVEMPGARPLEFEAGRDMGTILAEWPIDQIVKCLVPYHPDDPQEMRYIQEEKILTLAEACRHSGHQLLLEIIAGPYGPIDTQTVARALSRIYEMGVRPDWWKLEPASNAATWQAITDIISKNDPQCQGIVILGLEATLPDLMTSFEIASKFDQIKGFAVGRSIFGDIAKNWLAETIDDHAAVTQMVDRFKTLVDGWLRLKNSNAAGG
ncbi:MAG: 5-dehydro-2-deoxygluconokinase [Sneathiella sp.]|nr:5-dehydro-2-deoxygluconokinase [Sneathiella sp.]